MQIDQNPIGSLTGGITEQPAKIAPPDRVASSVNWLPWSERGLSTRPYTRWRCDPFTFGSPDARVRSADLGGDERYALLMSNQSVLVRNYAGVSFPVWEVTRNAAGTPTGSTAPSFEYLDLRADNKIRSSGLVGEQSCDQISGGSPPWGLNALPGSVFANAAGEGLGPVSPLGWEPTPNDQLTSGTSHMSTLTISAGASPNTGDWSKNVNGGWPSNRIKFSMWIGTNFDPDFATGAVFSLNLTKSTGTPNTLFVQYRWLGGSDSNPTPTVASTTGDAVGIYSKAERLRANVWRVQLEIDMVEVAGNSNPPIVGEIATATIGLQKMDGSGTGIYGWGAQCTYGGDHKTFEDYAFSAHTLRSTTIVDTTFLVNTNVVTGIDFSAVGDDKPTTFGQILFDGIGADADETVDADDAALVFIKQGIFEGSYSINLTCSKGATTKSISVLVASGTSGAATNDDPNVIAALVASAINGDSQNDTAEANQTLIIKAFQEGPVVVCYIKEDWTLDNWSANSSQGGSLIGLIHEEVTSIADLPLTAHNGFRVKLVGTSEVAGSVAFPRAVLKFVTDGEDDIDSGYWEEGTWYEKQLGFDETRLPHTLTRRTDDTSGTVTGSPLAVYFEWTAYDWEDAIVGDDDINPVPSFITTANNFDRRITDLAFYKNRMVLLSDQNCAMSEANRFGNFWRTTHLTLPDSERIDISVSHTKESILRHFGTVGGRALLFSSQSVFAIDQGAILSPTTVGFTALLGIGAHPDPIPASVGPLALFVPDTLLDGSSLRAMFLQSEDRAVDVDLSAETPTLVSQPPLALEVHQKLRVAFMLSSTNPNRIGWARVGIEDDGIKSAWAELDMRNDVISMTVLRDELVMLINQGGVTSMESMPIEVEPLADGLWEPSLDRRIDNTETVNVSYSAVLQLTTFTMPYFMKLDDRTRMKVIRRTGADHGELIPVVSVTGYTIVVGSDRSNIPLFIGLQQEKAARLLEPVLRDRAGAVKASARMSVRRLSVSYVNSGAMDVEVEAPDGTDTNTFTAEDMATLEDGEVRVMIGTQPRDMTVTLKNDSYRPAIVEGAEWDIIATLSGKG